MLPRLSEALWLPVALCEAAPGTVPMPAGMAAHMPPVAVTAPGAAPGAVAAVGGGAGGAAAAAASAKAAEEAAQMEKLKAIAQEEAVERARRAQKFPGQFDRLESDAQRLLQPDVFDGFKFEVSKPLGPKFGISHSIVMGSSMYQGGKHYVFGTTLMEQESLILGRVDMSGRVEARWHRMWSPALTTKIIGQLQQAAHQSQFSTDVDFKGEDFGLTVKVGNGVFQTTYLQALTDKWSAGCEGVYVHPRRVAATSVGGMYRHRGLTVSGKWASNGMLFLRYLRRVTPKVGLATEYVMNLHNRRSQVQFGYEFNLTAARLCGLLDATGNVHGLLEEKMGPMLTVRMSASLQHSKDAYRFGLGVQLGQ
eukprot:PLAT7793.1.p2 GENE.PLAT7793.1~~PLAT7793.1.p2  ORF type:complete len:372 (+),score=165.63 PLAT7793.1:24-1118(+)